MLRGARTLAARLEVHERQALEIARWLQARPDVGRVYHPALPEHPGHALWRRDFTGSNGLLSFEFARDDPALAARFVDALRLFGIGASWGGYESLAVLAELSGRGALPTASRSVVRLHVGLDDSASLIADLEQALAVATAR
ncbi:PLP-dependent transferase [Azotobacter beijerinckii]|uniref:PLP-dependent transferase n=1 Tax=Azotobacter beijerinckii TaxID=170623 RepID=UPI000AC60A07